MPILVPEGPSSGAFTAINTGTCTPWAVEADVCPPCDTYDFNPVILFDALQTASDILFDLTGRKWPGECSEIVRPCSEGQSWIGLQSFGPWPTTWGSGSYAYGSPWPSRDTSFCGCNRVRSCGCKRPSEIRLPGSPVTQIAEVKIDGEVIPSTRYRVDDYRWLVYLPESPGAERQGWPCCQDVTLDDGMPDTWSVSYFYGNNPPMGGVRAASALACQLALACVGDESCQLPERVTSLTRQGVSLAILDPLTLFADGLTGLNSVDLWVSSIRLGTGRRAASIHVPGQQAKRRRTTIPAGA